MSSNRVSGDFYDEANELKYAKNAGDVASGVVSRWWISSSRPPVLDLWKQIREVEASTELSNSEKKQQTRELKAIVTGIQKKRHRAGRRVPCRCGKSPCGRRGMRTPRTARPIRTVGAEYALQVYNKDVYERARTRSRTACLMTTSIHTTSERRGIKAHQHGERRIPEVRLSTAVRYQQGSAGGDLFRGYGQRQDAAHAG